MDKKLAIVLLLCLTLLGLTAMVGMIALELGGHPILGNLPTIVGQVVVALTALVAIMGQNLRPQVQEILDRSRANASKLDSAANHAAEAATVARDSRVILDKVHIDTNGGRAALEAKLDAVVQELALLKSQRSEVELIDAKLAGLHQRHGNPSAGGLPVVTAPAVVVLPEPKDG